MRQDRVTVASENAALRKQIQELKNIAFEQQAEINRLKNLSKMLIEQLESSKESNEKQKTQLQKISEEHKLDLSSEIGFDAVNEANSKTINDLGKFMGEDLDPSFDTVENEEEKKTDNSWGLGRLLPSLFGANNQKPSSPAQSTAKQDEPTTQPGK